MPNRNVLILESEQLLNAGVMNLLAQSEDLQVKGISLSDLDSSNNLFIEFKPDIIIVGEDDAAENSTQMADFTRKFPKILTLVIHLKDNHVEVIYKERVHIQKMNDFMSLLKVA